MDTLNKVREIIQPVVSGDLVSCDVNLIWGLVDEIEKLRKALELISHGYGIGYSADDYGEIARKALKEQT